MTGLQRCEIDRGTLFMIYQRWCKVNGITKSSNALALKNYLLDAARVWTDEGGETKMLPMKLAQDKWRWVKLSRRGVQLFEEVIGNNEYNRM